MTYEIIEDVRPGFFQVRIIEDDLSCASEPCYPNRLAPTSEDKITFADELMIRIAAQRADDARPPEEDML